MIYSQIQPFGFVPIWDYKVLARTMKITRRNARFEVEIPSNTKKVSNHYLED